MSANSLGSMLFLSMKTVLLAGLPALIFTSTCFAATCSTEVVSTDSMQFDKKAIEVPASCKDFTVNLKHSGKLGRNVMGHNWVLIEASDMKAVVEDGIAAGAAKDYLKPNDGRVLAATKLLGGGESDSVTFSTSKLKAGSEYMYFCSFPGHASLMKGQLKLSK